MTKSTKKTSLSISSPPTKRKSSKQFPVTTKASNNLTKASSSNTILINFRVSAEFRRELKTEAVSNDISMTELLHRMFDLWKEQN